MPMRLKLDYQPRRDPRGAEPLTPQRKWRAILLATLVLVPAFWSLLAGLVAVAADDAEGGPQPAAAIAFGLCLIPFVFIVAAFASWHPRPPLAVLQAMGLCLVIGIPVSALAADAVTGLVAGVGAGGVVALRLDPPQSWRGRAVAVFVASAYAFFLARFVGAFVLFSAPVFPLTAIGVADHISEWWNRESVDQATASDG